MDSLRGDCVTIQQRVCLLFAGLRKLAKIEKEFDKKMFTNDSQSFRVWMLGDPLVTGSHRSNVAH